MTFVFDIYVFVIADAGVLSSFAHMAVSESGGGAARRAAGAAEVAAKNRIGCALHALKQALDAIALIASSDQHVRICVFESFIYAFLLTFSLLVLLGQIAREILFPPGGEAEGDPGVTPRTMLEWVVESPAGRRLLAAGRLAGAAGTHRADFVFSLLDD